MQDILYVVRKGQVKDLISLWRLIYVRNNRVVTLCSK
jgi:hypothetical protein